MINRGIMWRNRGEIMSLGSSYTLPCQCRSAPLRIRTRQNSSGNGITGAIPGINGMYYNIVFVMLWYILRMLLQHCLWPLRLSAQWCFLSDPPPLCPWGGSQCLVHLSCPCMTQECPGPPPAPLSLHASTVSLLLFLLRPFQETGKKGAAWQCVNE